MTADVADPFHILHREHADDAACALRRICIHADDAGERVRRTHEIGVCLLRQRHVGGVAALSADENIILHARLGRRATLRFCIHALFRNALSGLSLIHILENFNNRRLVLESTHDVTASRATEHRLRLLLSELTHRVRNTLAVIPAIARHTLRNCKSKEDFVRCV